MSHCLHLQNGQKNAYVLNYARDKTARRYTVFRHHIKRSTWKIFVHMLYSTTIMPLNQCWVALPSLNINGDAWSYSSMISHALLMSMGSLPLSRWIWRRGGWRRRMEGSWGGEWEERREERLWSGCKISKAIENKVLHINPKVQLLTEERSNLAEWLWGDPALILCRCSICGVSSHL